MKVTVCDARPASSVVGSVFFDEPTRSANMSGPLVRVAGWLTTTEVLGPHLELRYGSQPVGSVSLLPRLEVARSLGLAEPNRAYGFDGLVNLLSLGQSSCLTAWAVSGNGVPIPAFICSTKINLPPSSVQHSDRVQPCYIVSLGRSGSTALMKMLNQQPGIAMKDQYPLECMHSAWLARDVLQHTSPANHNTLGPADVWDLASGTCASPFLHPDFVPYEEICRYGSRTFDAACERALQLLIDFYFAEISALPGARIKIVEKAVPSALLNVLSWVFPQSRFIFLVRHPADVFLSRWSFALKRGDRGFGGSGDRDPLGLRKLAYDCARLLDCIEALHAERAHVVRFEDLMDDPASSITRICKFLGLPSNARTNVNLPIDDLGHRTSSTTQRWQEEMSDDVLREIGHSCAAHLSKFGYEFDRSSTDARSITHSISV